MPSNLERLLSVVSNVGTPLALSGVIVIMLHALYKHVLVRKVCSRMGADPTSRLLQKMLDKLFWLALMTLILGAVSYGVTAFIHPA